MQWKALSYWGRHFGFSRPHNTFTVMAANGVMPLTDECAFIERDDIDTTGNIQRAIFMLSNFWKTFTIIKTLYVWRILVIICYF